MSVINRVLQDPKVQEALRDRQYLLANYSEVKPKKPKKGFGRPCFNIPESQQRYELYFKLHQMWKQYIAQVLQQNYSKVNISNKLLRADFHGAKIKVWKAACVNYVGIQGIVVHQTQRSFRVITPKNQVKMLLKQDAVFLIEIGDKFIKLYGENFQARPADRAKLKWKRKALNFLLR